MPEYSEVIPCFLMSGDKLVEAFYMRWESDDGLEWTAVDKNIKIPINQEATVDRLIVEMPIGCVMTRFLPTNAYPGDTYSVNLTSDSGSPWEPCQRPHMERAMQEELADG